MARLYDALHKGRSIRERGGQASLRSNRELTRVPVPFSAPPSREPTKPRRLASAVPTESVSTAGSSESVMSSVSSKSDMHSVCDLELSGSGRIWEAHGDLVGAIQDLQEMFMADVPPRPDSKKLQSRRNKMV